MKTLKNLLFVAMATGFLVSCGGGADAAADDAAKVEANAKAVADSVAAVADEAKKAAADEAKKALDAASDAVDKVEEEVGEDHGDHNH